VIGNPANGRLTTAPVLDVGPWNTSDTYVFTGAMLLAVGQFAARARGQNGQVVTNPAGIDLTPSTVLALGLAPNQGLWKVM
jgi:hypothetical protein